MSHPTWVRGLKLPFLYHLRKVMGVAPYVGAWIETVVKHFAKSRSWSHPTWVRGLKQMQRSEATQKKRSHPTWVRGLKLHGQSKET